MTSSTIPASALGARAEVPSTDLLARIPLFEGLSKEDRAALEDHLATHRFSAGEVVLAKGDPGSSLYLIRSGSVRIFLPPEDARIGESVVLTELHAGDYFGELSLFDNRPRSASVEALTELILLELTRADLEDLLARSHGAAMAIVGKMSDRLRETNDLLSERASINAIRRLEESLTWGQRLADRVAALNGSWAFILFLIVLSGAWAVLNRVAAHPFDRYPYEFYNLALALLVALQGPLIVMSQNRQTEKDRARAETDFRINLKNEVGIEAIQRELFSLRVDAGQRLDALERALTPPVANEVNEPVPHASEKTPRRMS